MPNTPLFLAINCDKCHCQPGDNFKNSILTQTSSTTDRNSKNKQTNKNPNASAQISLSKKRTKSPYEQDVLKLVPEDIYASDGLCINIFIVLLFKSEASDILNWLWGSSFGRVGWIIQSHVKI